ncbi:integrase arm-type DNA-binding domain-containing protein [Duganella sp. FT3S]|uniref:Integrase arm-type DNA-binding domain-containing protein n=1 Tax=Rugamonas fusca TaxID=2758568 RepID=A0A7W2I6I4_9BURK|nr:integrase arm-type DNA-binding domain-containing protein [Rugamonas fusca]MBA5605390.1 integrase arm-type DNA-binding domain-containing protein [Rugamonas fusca]
MAGGIGGGKLTDKAVKAFAAKAERGKKLADGGGLHLFVTPAGGITWRIKYRLDGKEKLYSVGPYPLVPLAAARVELGEVKSLLLEGKDPVTHRRVNRAAHAASTDNTFQAVAEEWLTMKKKEWSAGHHTKSSRAFERDIYPSLGKLPIASITPAMVATTIQDVHKRDVLETASRILQHLNGVFRYSQAKGLCRDNPAAPAREVLPRKKDSGRMPALLDYVALGDVLRRAQLARLSPAVHLAHRLCAFTASRIGNVVNAEWSEFKLEGDQPVWTIPRAKMKVTNRDIDHRIPLCAEIAGELRDWQAMIGRKGYVFPSPAGGKHIGRESIEKVYRVTLNLAGKHSPHGWRSALSTLARDHGFERDVVELALDHAHDDEVARAYDRGERFSQRIELFNWWGSQLAKAQAGGKILPLNKTATA